MGDAVPARRRAPVYHDALEAAAVVIGDLRRGEQPQEEAWESARAVFAGMLPPPKAAQWAELPDDDDDDDAADDRELRDVAGSGD
eukprot:5462845-Prymnesium_polylepis.1